MPIARYSLAGGWEKVSAALEVGRWGEEANLGLGWYRRVDTT